MEPVETIFHRIIRREIPADIVFEDEHVLAFRDVNPVSPQHVLVIPKKTIPSLNEAQPQDSELLGHMLLVCGKIAEQQGLKAEGYRVVINTGQHGGQSVFQLHFHVLGGRPFSWPPG